MDNLALRVAALELLFVKVGDWLEPGALDEVSRSIKIDIAATRSPEQVEVCGFALAMIRQAQARIRPPLPDRRDGPAPARA